MIIALDGPAGVGKSTIASLIAKELGFYYLNSGNFYRTVTYKVISQNLDPTKDSDVIQASQDLNIKIIDNQLHLDEINIEAQLHTDQVDKYVAGHSAIVEVRKNINKILKKITAGLDIVAEGRDMATVVFPDAEVKVYLDASVKERANRRFNQGVSNLTYEEIYESIKSRDNIDKNKEFGKLEIAEDAIYIDTTGLTIVGVCEKVVSIINRKK